MTNKSRATFYACLVIMLISGAASPEISDEGSRVARIRELMELTGASDLGVQVMNNMLESMKPALPQVPTEWWEGLKGKVDPVDLEELLIPIYEENFTDEEIDAMLDFYRTPVGRSIILKTPIIMQKSMAAGQAWGQRLAEDVFRDLQEAGYDLPQGP